MGQLESFGLTEHHPFSPQWAQQRMPPLDDPDDGIDEIDLRVDKAWGMAPVPYRPLTIRTLL